MDRFHSPTFRKTVLTYPQKSNFKNTYLIQKGSYMLLALILSKFVEIVIVDADGCELEGSPAAVSIMVLTEEICCCMAV